MTATADPRATILLVEDDPAVATLCIDSLGARDYRVWHAANASEAEAMLDQARPDLIVVDLMLPDRNGLLLCADLKEKHHLPLIICSATKRKDDAVIGLKLGADDFIAKPFSIAELEARVEATLRRASSKSEKDDVPSQPRLRVGELVVDQGRCQVTLGRQPVQLTPIEYRLLTVFAGCPDEVLSREELAEQVWGYYDAAIGRSLEVHLRRLRVKLEGGAVPPPRIVTVRGFGYRLTTEPLSETTTLAPH
jgi:two-component system, OmpR family, response regulator MtrA